MRVCSHLIRRFQSSPKLQIVAYSSRGPPRVELSRALSERTPCVTSKIISCRSRHENPPEEAFWKNPSPTSRSTSKLERCPVVRFLSHQGLWPQQILTELSWTTSRHSSYEQSRNGIYALLTGQRAWKVNRRPGPRHINRPYGASCRIASWEAVRVMQGNMQTTKDPQNNMSSSFASGIRPDKDLFALGSACSRREPNIRARYVITLASTRAGAGRRPILQEYCYQGQILVLSGNTCDI
jgi:hypothetical protein